MSEDIHIIGGHEEPEQAAGQHEMHHVVPLSGMYESWFLDYASYVILERAVPELLDGLKPVQRRLLHAMWELEDGRYNKVANIIGHTMKYHPHGDASIGDALVQLGQKDLLIDTQGNWGNILTGDSAAAPRYIEARLSKFALDVVFNPKTTAWKPSYDGRNKEPVILPVKFPLLLASGIEGIAVGLASKILPHNFIELIESSIKILKNEDFEIYPDFPTAGSADFSRYNQGLRGGKVRIRARITKQDKKILTISELPYGVTTGGLIDSIVTANEKGKIKIRKIDDNTADNVEIVVHLQPGVSPDTTIDALYAFTDCEISVSPNSCVIHQEKPQFLGVKELLRISTRQTVDLLRMELEIRKQELLNQLHFASLEKIFIERRIYRKIEECLSWDEVLETISKGLEPYTKKFIRPVTHDDIVRLTEIKIKRISKYSSFAADQEIERLNNEIQQIDNHLNHLTEYAIQYFTELLRKHANGRERKTEIRNFDTIAAAAVAAATQKLYVNRLEGFAGWALKKDEYVCECSDLDDIIVFRDNGTFQVLKVAEKLFVGKGVIHIDVFKRNDDRTIYNLVYRHGKNGPAMVKRFAVIGITRDKEYDLTGGAAGSKVMYFTANPNGEAEIIKIFLKPKPRLKKLVFEYDFSSLTIKSRTSKGNVLSKNPIQKIVKFEEGVSTLGARSIWFDDSIRRLNADGRGRYLGDFIGDDKILTVMQSGMFLLTGFDLGLHFDEDLVHLQKYCEGMILTVVYYHTEKKFYFVKRFVIDNTDKKTLFLPEPELNLMVLFSTQDQPQVLVRYDNSLNKKPLEDQLLNLADIVEVMGVKAMGKKVSKDFIKQITAVQVEETDSDELESSGENETSEETSEAMVAIEEGEVESELTGEQDINAVDQVSGLEEKIAENTAENKSGAVKVATVRKKSKPLDQKDSVRPVISEFETDQTDMSTPVSLEELFPPEPKSGEPPKRSGEDTKQMTLEF